MLASMVIPQFQPQPQLFICGQSYKQFMLVNYHSRVIPDLKTPHITTLESYITIIKCFIILTTDLFGLFSRSPFTIHVWYQFHYINRVRAINLDTMDGH